ncbi:MAG: SIMPL domain-containing protein [Bacteroidaceae bacterium]|nr:SIMPL domain-containing protein [Bacteroidaceae bacterium]MBQ3622131.1 SIMPL domain-containing protein [Bacteroidaceae bacterium]
MKKFEFELSGLAGVGICIMIGLMVLGNCVGDSIEKMADKDRYVTVKGLAEREVMADKVIWPLPYYCLGNNLEELYDRVEKDKNIILEFLKENGINSNEIVMSAPIVTDREAQMYAPENIKYRYRVESVITVISSQVEKVIALMGSQAQLMKNGIAIEQNYSYRTQFEFTGLNSLKPEMIEEATSNARAVAQKFADDSKSRLNGIRRANQGQFSINSDENTPQLKKIRVVTTVDYFLK